MGKAQIRTVLKLAKVLGCSVEKLVGEGVVSLVDLYPQESMAEILKVIEEYSKKTIPVVFVVVGRQGTGKHTVLKAIGENLMEKPEIVGNMCFDRGKCLYEDMPMDSVVVVTVGRQGEIRVIEKVEELNLSSNATFRNIVSYEATK